MGKFSRRYSIERYVYFCVLHLVLDPVSSPARIVLNTSLLIVGKVTKTRKKNLKAIWLNTPFLPKKQGFNTSEKSELQEFRYDFPNFELYTHIRVV